MAGGGQEFMIGATGAKSFKEAVRMTAEVRPPLKSRIREIRLGIGVKTSRGSQYLRRLRADEEARINPYYSESLRHACACAAGACLRTRFVLKPSVSLSRSLCACTHAMHAYARNAYAAEQVGVRCCMSVCVETRMLQRLWVSCMLQRLLPWVAA